MMKPNTFVVIAVLVMTNIAPPVATADSSKTTAVAETRKVLKFDVLKCEDLCDGVVELVADPGWIVCYADIPNSNQDGGSYGWKLEAANFDPADKSSAPRFGSLKLFMRAGKHSHLYLNRVSLVMVPGNTSQDVRFNTRCWTPTIANPTVADFKY